MKVKVWCEECQGEIATFTILHNGQFCKVCKGNGYIEKELVELDPNQDLPKAYYATRKKRPWVSTYDVETEAQQEMLRAGFRKVKIP